MPIPQTRSLDGEDWTVYWLSPGEWERLRVWERDPPEAAERRLPAVVPGHAQDALIRAGRLPEPFVGENCLHAGWVPQNDWVFEKRFQFPAELAHARLVLRFEGIDDTAHVFLNGERLGRHEGAFVPAEWDVTAQVRTEEENHLLVVVERTLLLQPLEGDIGWRLPWKSRIAYDWEFVGPFLVPVGLWDSVSLVVTGGAWIEETTVYANVSLDRTEAALSVVSEFGARSVTPALVVAEVTQAGLPVAEVQDPITLFPDGTSLVQSLVVPRVQLWWPNGAGRQPLYMLRLSVVDEDGRLLDRRTVEFGVRQVEALPCEGAPPDSLPYAIAVNGKRLWLRGWNWLPQDQLYGREAGDRYERLLTLARDAGVNLIRVAGEGLIEKEVFYRLCGRLGIMVWQDFPLEPSTDDNTLSTDPEYLNQIREQAEAILPRRRNHPSLVLWCGGDELADVEARPLGSDHPALAELRTAVQVEDPQRLWLPATPSGPVSMVDPARCGELHDVHGPWESLPPAEAPRFFDSIDPLLHGAFGGKGASSLETLEALFDGEAPASATDHPVWRIGWPVQKRELALLEGAFGTLVDAGSLVRASQLLQAINLQYGVEANRRREGRCAGVIPWHFNEPRPMVVGASAVEHSLRPKPAYYAVKRAYAPFHVSASFPTFAWAGEAQLRADVWLHNAGEERSLLNVVATVLDLDGRELYQENLCVEAPAERSENVGDLYWRFPPGLAGPFLLFLEVVDEEGEVLARNAYYHSRAAETPFAGFLQAPRTQLEVERTPEGLTVRNAGTVPALEVWIDAGMGYVEDSAFPLSPGAARALRLRDVDGPVTVSAWNADPVQFTTETQRHGEGEGKG